MTYHLSTWATADLDGLRAVNMPALCLDYPRLACMVAPDPVVSGHRVAVGVHSPTPELLADWRYPQVPRMGYTLEDYRTALRRSHERLCTVTVVSVKIGKTVHELPASWDYQAYLESHALELWAGAESVTVWLDDGRRVLKPALFKVLFKTYRSKLRDIAGVDLLAARARIETMTTLIDGHGIQLGEGVAR
jgi:hypothetical protein